MWLSGFSCKLNFNNQDKAISPSELSAVKVNRKDIFVFATFGQNFPLTATLPDRCEPTPVNVVLSYIMGV